jgi:cation transport ATPase
MSENPYAASQTFDAPPAPDGEAELIRKEHLKTEASIKAVGTLYHLICVMATLSIYGMLSRGSFDRDALFLAILVVIVILFFFTAWGVRRFRPWARIVVASLSGIALLAYIATGGAVLFNGGIHAGGDRVAMLVGVLINGSILRLMFCKKGRMVFSAPYREIITATPHIKYRTSKVVWILLGVLVVIFAGMVVLGILNR